MGCRKALQHGEKEHVKLLDFRARSEEKIRENNEELTALITDNDARKTELISLEEMVLFVGGHCLTPVA